ncbi:hypothetical protein NUW58_g9835 [Xylaria curta]|uniref:Uncharacterized protein n=1 Tax=Xylaria curta TaxID=42375 RepID=A0ACC1MUE7_9PEZI|nr:hypothetical protein NUW58_g9835 [Xylaria curta]
MANEGCQTMELDQSSPRPPSAHSDIHIDMMVTKHEHKSDATPNVGMESVMEHGTKTPPTRTWPPESSIPNARPLISSEFIGPNLGAPPSHSDQQLSPSRDTFTGIPWKIEIPPPHLGQQQNTLFTPSHVDESFAPSGFGNIISAGQPAPFDESDSLRKTRSVDFEDQASTNEGIIHSNGPGTPAFNYPPLSPTEDTRLQPNQDDALTNYPSSYLESGPSSLPGQVMGDQQPVVTGVGLNSWATVNHNSNVTAMPPTDRLGSRDGDTPEQALVIDESDSDSNSDSDPEPMAVEDIVDEGRAYALGMYEDVEAEDEVDAQYSDDDEPEYDVDEMGGDYDTRIYERPDDDDDGGDDEDIGPRPLDSEFGDEESWDEEEEEDLLDEDNEAEFETDVEMDEPDPQPVVRANPTVIDLISSSEDESEDADEDEDNDIPTETQQPSAHIDSRTSSSRQQILSEGDPPHTDLNDDESDISDIISQAPISEANISSEVDVEDHENMSSHYEEEEESENEGMDDDDDESEDQDEDIRAGAELKTFVREEVHVLESPEDQAGRDAEESAALPFSASDGLETLSHVIDEESSARSHSVFAELSVEKIVIETISDQQLPAEPPEDDDDGFQIQDSSDNQLVDDSILEGAPEEIPRHGGGEDQVEQTSPPISDDEHPHNKDYTPAALSSPPLTQSFQSHIKADSHWASEEITVTSAAQIATAQLPTPLNTQVTNTAPDVTPDTFTTIAESFDSYTTIYQSHSNIREGSTLDVSIDDLVQQDISMSLNFDGVNQERNGAPVAEPEAHHSAGEQSTTSSPAPSFQTQVDDGELAWSVNVEQAKTEGQHIRSQSPEDGSDAPDRPKSFISQMEIDEELQASILEYSQLEEEYTDYDIQDGYDASSQGGTHETDFGSPRRYLCNCDETSS